MAYHAGTGQRFRLTGIPIDRSGMNDSNPGGHPAPEPPEWSPAVVTSWSLATAALTVAILLLPVRLAVPTPAIAGPWVPLLVVASGWLAGLWLLREWSSRQPVNRKALYLVAAVWGLILMAWSASPAIGLSAVAPLALVAAGEAVFRKSGWRITRQPETLPAHPEPTATIAAPPVPEVADRPIPEAAQPSAATDPGEALDESAVWQTVQDEFARDTDLVRNVTRWETRDGQQTVMINVRCQLTDGPSRVHIPVWPALPTNPETFCRALPGGHAVEIRVLQRRPGGLVLDVVPAGPLKSPGDDSVVLEIIAVSQLAMEETPAA